MANKVTSRLLGKEELKTRLSALDLRAHVKLREVLSTSSLAIERGAKQRCPVNKQKGLGGRLRGSIRTKFYNNGFTSEVGTDVEYARFVEFGTGRRGAVSLPVGTPLPEGYKHGGKEGAAAQPYLYPALESERPNFLKRVKEEVF
jgi:hypothetical protein